MIDKKIVITGGSGLLGFDLNRVLKSFDLYSFSKENLNVTKLEQTYAKLKIIKPDIIIHTAALTNVDYCELNPEISYKVNVLSTSNIIDYCFNFDCKLIFISSTGIYGKQYTNKNYSESDIIIPTTVHHKNKYDCELLIIKKLNNFLILRTGWLYGGPIHHKKNFVMKRYFEAQKSKLIYSDNSQIGNPTSTFNLASQIKLLIKRNITGTFNCVDEASNITRYNYVCEIIENFDLNCEVKIAGKGVFDRVAPISCNESALNTNLIINDLNIMENWKIALKNYINEIKTKLR